MVTKIETKEEWNEPCVIYIMSSFTADAHSSCWVCVSGCVCTLTEKPHTFDMFSCDNVTTCHSLHMWNMKIHVKTCDDMKCSKKKCFSTCENCTIFINGVCVFVLGSVSLSLGHSCTVALQACSVPYPLLVLPLSQVQGPVNGQAQVTHPTSPGQSGGSQGGLFCTCKNKQYHLILHQTNSSAQASSLPKPHTTNQISQYWS